MSLTLSRSPSLIAFIKATRLFWLRCNRSTTGIPMHSAARIDSHFHIKRSVPEGPHCTGLGRALRTVLFTWVALAPESATDAARPLAYAVEADVPWTTHDCPP